MIRKAMLLLVACSIALLASYDPAFSAKPKPKPKPKPAPKADVVVKDVPWAVKVNGKIIPMSVYDKAVEVSEKEMMPEGEQGDVSTEEIKANRRSILAEMIEDEVLNQWAKKQGIVVTEKDLSSRIAAMKKEFPSSTEFYKSLQARGMSQADLNKSVASGLIENRLIKMKSKEITVSDEEIKRFYDKNIDLYVQKSSLHLRQILVGTKEKALTVIERLKAGESFAEVAKRFSEDNDSKADGGDIGMVAQGQLPATVEAVAFKMTAGTVSNVIEADNAFYVIKVEEKFPKKETTLEAAKENIRKFLVEEKARSEYLKGLEEEKKAATLIVNDDLKFLFL